MKKVKLYKGPKFIIELPYEVILRQDKYFISIEFFVENGWLQHSKNCVNCGELFKDIASFDQDAINNWVLVDEEGKSFWVQFNSIKSDDEYSNTVESNSNGLSRLKFSVIPFSPNEKNLKYFEDEELYNVCYYIYNLIKK